MKLPRLESANLQHGEAAVTKLVESKMLTLVTQKTSEPASNAWPEYTRYTWSNLILCANRVVQVLVLDV